MQASKMAIFDIIDITKFTLVPLLYQYVEEQNLPRVLTFHPSHEDYECLN